MTKTKDKDGIMDLIAPTTMKRYKPKKIEKFGEQAMQLVLDAIKKGRSYHDIATMLSETYGKKVYARDVMEVMNLNSQLMVEYQKYIDDKNLSRANMVLNEVTVMVDDMEKLDVAFSQLESKLRNGVDTKNLPDVSKAMTDMVRTRSALMKNFKKLTGQFHDSPMVVVDQSNKTVNVNASSESINKLSKELAKADFKSSTPVKEIDVSKELPSEIKEMDDSEDKAVDNVIDAEYSEVNEKKVEENNDGNEDKIKESDKPIDSSKVETMNIMGKEIDKKATKEIIDGAKSLLK